MTKPATSVKLYHPDAAERLARDHTIEGADDWQYAHWWRFARATDPHPILGPPPGPEWVLNDYHGEGANRTVVPSWSDGGVVMQLTHWRRPSPGMLQFYPHRTLHARVEWDGDPKP